MMTSREVPNSFAEDTLEGRWEKVIQVYKDIPEAHTTLINDKLGTALHVAVELDEEHFAQELVNAIIMECPAGGTKVKALEVINKRGETPLHVAAARGFAKICKLIIGKDNERIYLTSLKNKLGETPLFQAAINGNKTAFAYLSTISGNSATLHDLVRLDRDSILHCVIRREYFDLAVIIVHYYDFLSAHMNEEGFTPLKVLATRPSAFRSASKFPWWKLILYHLILVEPLDPERQMKANLAKMEQQPKSDEVNDYPKNYATLMTFYEFLAGSFALLVGKMPSKKNKIDTENPSMNKQSTTQQAGFLPPNYETFKQFVRSVYVHILGLSGIGLKDVKHAKKRHEWSGQLLKALMERPYAAFTGTGGVPTDMEVETDMYDVYSQFKQGETSELRKPGEETQQEADENKLLPSPSYKTKKENAQLADEKETAFLVAARNGIVEMVHEILNGIPSAIRETNSQNENVLLVAVSSRQPLVVKSLQMKMQSKPEVWNNLILAVNKDEKTMLHLAGYSRHHKLWKVSGSALQMMWDIKWFKYIKSLLPQEFYLRSDKNGKTAFEIFGDTHEDLVEQSSGWLKDTSESCSVVAALVAGVSFATATSIPGDTNDKDGKPNLEGEPAFNVFAIASLVGLCFSVTGLIMFLTILTSRKQAKDFSRALPLKLLLGLNSLFVAIAAMLVSFCIGNSFLLSNRYKIALSPIYAATCFPVTFYAVSQFPLYFDLLTAILTKVPRASDKGDML